MNITNSVVLAVGLSGLLAGCGSSPSEPAAPPSKMEARVSTVDAVPKIAAAECDHEEKCKGIGEALKFSDRAHCLKVKSEELSKDFNDDGDCKNGISTTDLEECLTKTRDQSCTGLSSVIGGAERSGECGSSDLCLD